MGLASKGVLLPGYGFAAGCEAKAVSMLLLDDWRLMNSKIRKRNRKAQHISVLGSSLSIGCELINCAYLNLPL